jgi:hypothetical protein
LLTGKKPWYSWASRDFTFFEDRKLTLVKTFSKSVWFVFQQEASSKGYYVKNKDGADYNGWCWPGNEDVENYVRELCTL